MYWVIQKYLSNGDSQKFIKALDSLGIAYEELPDHRTLATLPGRFRENQTMFYGNTYLTSLVASKSIWKPGVITNSNFNLKVWSEAWKDRCLNNLKNSKVMLVSEAEDLPDSQDLVFTRPCQDNKSFSGAVMSVSGVKGFAVVARYSDPSLLSEEIILAPISDITEEWRLFIVDNKISTGSSYQRDGESYQTSELPSSVRDLAEDAIKSWTPANVFTLDVGLVKNEPYIIECGCFNHAGIYAADIKKLIKDVNYLYD